MTHNTISICAASLLTSTLLLTSCFKDEPPGSECDILEATVSVPHPAEVFFNESDSAVRVLSDATTVQFTVRRSADLSHLAPRFRITEGASIEPESGSVHDFSQGAVSYTVTSEDRQWTRTYQVLFKPTTITVTDTVKFDFEHFQLDDSYQKFYEWYEVGHDGMEKLWASGNGGFMLANSSKSPDEYPTVPCDDGVEGKCLRLTTLDTGPLGRSTGRPIAAGNLFLGSFNTAIALRDALHATEMGVPFTQQPVRLTGYYRYEPGPEFKNKAQQVVENRTDSADIYAVLYRNHDDDGQPIVLYGDNVLSSPLIVLRAQMAEVKPAREWTRFEMAFDGQGDVDRLLLQNRGYSLALVFAASKHGDTFEGAIGSTLYIDNVRIICTHDE